MSHYPRVRRGDFGCADDYAHTLYEAGGPEPGQRYSFSAASGLHRSRLSAIWGDTPEQLAESAAYAEAEEQWRRQHAFVRKCRVKPWKLTPAQPPPLPTVTLRVPRVNPFARSLADTPDATPSRLISETDFERMHAAAEFATELGLLLDTSLTISWSLLGITGDKEVQKGLRAFEKCLREWCTDKRHRMEAAYYLYSHETGPMLGLHTHMILHVPWWMRPAFRTWAESWPTRHAGRPAPKALRVSRGNRESLLRHWLAFSYLVKGYDRAVIVQSARNAPDGKDVKLGDLIAWPWADPGPVPLHWRAGVSHSLGPEQRARGVPSGSTHVGWVSPFTLPYRPKPEPFRSSYEDGARDIRRLYPKEFHERVTRLSAPTKAANVDAGGVLSALLR